MAFWLATSSDVVSLLHCFPVFLCCCQWLSDLDEKCGSATTGIDRIPTMLVMNKVDLMGKLQRANSAGADTEEDESKSGADPGQFVGSEEVQEFREKHGINMFAKTSAKFDGAVQAFGNNDHPPPNHSVHAAITMLANRVYMRKSGMDFSHKIGASESAATPPRGFKLGEAERARDKASATSRCCSGAT